jgi:hypothetical protein
MRVLIQNCANSLFVGPQGTWTIKPDDALDFERTLRAVRYLNDLKLKDVQIVLRFDGRGEDVVLAAAAPHAGSARGSV